MKSKNFYYCVTVFSDGMVCVNDRTYQNRTKMRNYKVPPIVLPQACNYVSEAYNIKLSVNTRPQTLINKVNALKDRGGRFFLMTPEQFNGKWPKTRDIFKLNVQEWLHIQKKYSVQSD